MEYTDTYKTIGAPCEGLYKEKGSKFIAYAFPVSDEQQIKELIVRLKKEHHSARHHCFAWRLGSDLKLFRVNDDGEPSGTAGRPIFGQIQQHDLTDILVVVVRYFGGILLGTSGLTNAYKQAAANVLTNALIVERIVETAIEVNFDYLAMNDFMMILKEFQLEMKESQFDLFCKAKILVRKQLTTIVLEKLEKIDKLNASIIMDN
ncbi:MAG: YigZ family protein [Bacteroidia bacterium]|nr:YigZ family protein [Bacteroidia bacterium]